MTAAADLCASATLDIAGVALTPDLSGALWWSAERTLVVSDLHLEKGSAYAARGQVLPPYDTRATLAELESVIAARRPARVIALGDSFHDATTDARMAADDRAALAALVAAVDDWIWIEGNHDPQPPEHLGGVVRAELTLGPLTFRHEPTGAAGEVAGHLHPCAKVARRGRTVRRRCFATDGARLVMPAFGAFTGGLNVCDPAFDAAFPDAPPSAFMLGRDQVWPVAARRLLPDR